MLREAATGGDDENMNDEKPPAERTDLLVSQLIDGQLSGEETAELNALVQSDAGHLERAVDQLLLDSLLTEELGTESLTALVDLVAAPATRRCGNSAGAGTEPAYVVRRHFTSSLETGRLVRRGCGRARRRVPDRPLAEQCPGQSHVTGACGDRNAP